MSARSRIGGPMHVCGRIPGVKKGDCARTGERPKGRARASGRAKGRRRKERGGKECAVFFLCVPVTWPSLCLLPKPSGECKKRGLHDTGRGQPNNDCCVLRFCAAGEEAAIELLRPPPPLPQGAPSALFRGLRRLVLCVRTRPRPEKNRRTKGQDREPATAIRRMRGEVEREEGGRARLKPTRNRKYARTRR